jgi:hypothetical protein
MHRRGWRPTKKQALTALGAMAVVAVMIATKDVPNLADAGPYFTGGTDEGTRRPRRPSRSRRRGRFWRWWHGHDGDANDDFEDIVVHPDEK